MGEAINFSSAAFRGGANFSDTTFSGEADFSGAAFSGEPFFKSAKFSVGVYFKSVTFSGGANFSSTTFSGEANFFDTTFNNLAYFKDSIFLNSLNLVKAGFHGYADFRGSKIRKLDFNNNKSPRVFPSRLDFRGAVITEAHFQDLVFEKDVDFSDVAIGQLVKESPSKAEEASKKEPQGKVDKGEETTTSFSTVFRFVTFESDAFFLRTKFLGPMAFEKVNFKKEANFREAAFKKAKKFSLSYLNFKDLWIRWAQFPPIESWIKKDENMIKSFSDKEIEETETRKEEGIENLSKVFKRLEENFRARNLLSDANSAYYHRENAELEEKKTEKIPWWKKLFRMLWQAWGIISGYGTKIERIAVCALVLNLLFTLLYWIGANLERHAPPKPERDFTFKLRFRDFTRDYLADPGESTPWKLTTALRFSSVILFKIGPRDTTISGKMFWILNAKIFVWLEWWLGVLLMAALAYTLANTVPVIHWLISGIL